MTSGGVRRHIAGVAFAVAIGGCSSVMPTTSPSTATPSAPSAIPAPTTSRATPSSPVASISTSPGLTPVPAANDVADRVLSTVRSMTGGARVDLVPEVDPWGVQVDGTVDDGGGPGRLLVVVSPAGRTGANLCADPDFVQGGPCRRIELANGDLRFERGLVEAHGVRTIVVAIRRADGSSVLLEAGNFRIDAPPVLVGGQPRPTPEITRDSPSFRLDALVMLADAISEATRGCEATACP